MYLIDGPGQGFQYFSIFLGMDGWMDLLDFYTTPICSWVTDLLKGVILIEIPLF